MKLAVSINLVLALFVVSSPVDAWKPPHGCAKYCVVPPPHFHYKCPNFCKSEVCYDKHWAKGVKCLPTPPPPPPPLPKGCAKVCVANPWKYGYKCPNYCKTESCHKNHQKGIKCLPTPPPLPTGCAKVCVATPRKYGYKCPHYCKTESCHKHHQKGIKCLPTPPPKPTCEEKCVTGYGKHAVRKNCNTHHCKVVTCTTYKWGPEGLKCTKKTAHDVHKPKPACPNKCVTAHALKAQGCDELKCQVDYCKKTYNGESYVKCKPL